MKLEIRDTRDKGTLEERVVLIAKEDCDIGKYFVFISKMSDGKIIYTSIQKPFWFPDKLVKKNDLIILYTRRGSSSFKVNTDGSTSHFYFRNLSDPILKDSYFALLVEANTWQIEK